MSESPSQGSTPRRLPPRQVIYKSSALAATAPDLANQRYTSECIKAAAKKAEEVRERFKAGQSDNTNVPVVQGDGEAADAQRHHRRVALNRNSAASSRLRKEAYVSALESQLANLEEKYNMLVDIFEGMKDRRSDHERCEYQAVEYGVDEGCSSSLLNGDPPQPLQPPRFGSGPVALPGQELSGVLNVQGLVYAGYKEEEGVDVVRQRVGEEGVLYCDTATHQGSTICTSADDSEVYSCAGASDADSNAACIDEAHAVETGRKHVSTDETLLAGSLTLEDVLAPPEFVPGLAELDPVLYDEIMRMSAETGLVHSAVDLDIVTELGDVPALEGSSFVHPGREE